MSFYLMGAKWNRNMKKCLVNVFLIPLLRVLQRVWITCEIGVSSSGVETECEPCGDLRATLSMRLGSALLVGGDPSPVPSPLAALSPLFLSFSSVVTTRMLVAA